MRRALLTLTVLAAATAAGAQSYDRYGGGGAYTGPPVAQGPTRVLTWSGKQNVPAPQMAPQMAPPPGYPQQAYPQGQYPQAQYPQAQYPQPQYAQPYPPQAYYPQQQQQQAQGGFVPVYGQPQQPQRQQGGPQTYPSMYSPPYGAQQAQAPMAYPAYPAQPQTAYQQPQPYTQPQVYQQQQAARPQASNQPQAGFQPQSYYPVEVVTQPMIAPTRVQNLAAQPQASAPPVTTGRNAEPPVSAAPTIPVQSQPLPTSIYAPTAPRADLVPAEQPSSDGVTAVAALDPRLAQGPRHYSVHRPFGIAPDHVPTPAADNQVLFTATEAEIVDQAPTGLRGVGMDEDKPAKAKSDD